MKFADVNELCDLIREMSFDISSFSAARPAGEDIQKRIGASTAEAGRRSDATTSLSVYDEDGTLLGEFFADLFIENWLIVELKAVRAVVDEHVAHIAWLPPFWFGSKLVF